MGEFASLSIRGCHPVEVTEERVAFSGIVFAEGRYVMTNAGFSYTTAGVWVSEDGVAWERAAGERGLFNSVVYGGGRFVCAGEEGRLATSEDGVTWTEGHFPFIEYFYSASLPRYADVDALAYHGDCFLALSSSFSYPIIGTSKDGVTWTIASFLEYELATGLRQMGGETYLLGKRGYLWRVPETGVSDLRRLLPCEPWFWKGVAANEGRMVIAGESGHVAWSDDGEQFHHLILPEADDVEDLVWAEAAGLFLAVGGDSAGAKAWRSSDGVTWIFVVIPSFTDRAAGVAWDGSQFVACGAGGQLAGSTDGADWEPRVSGVEQPLRSIKWGGGRFAAVGEESTVIFSDDGYRWEVAGNLPYPNLIRPTLVFGRGVWKVSFGSVNLTTTDFHDWWTAGGELVQGNPVFTFGEFVKTDGRTVASSSEDFFTTGRYDSWAEGAPYDAGAGFQRGARFGNRVYLVGQYGLIGASGEWRDFFEEWKNAKFSALELMEEAISGAEADPDGDGWSNAHEYALGLAPKVSELESRVFTKTQFPNNSASGFVGLHAIYEHHRESPPPGVSVWLEPSDNLREWWIGEQYAEWISDQRIARSIPLRTNRPLYLGIRAEVVRP
jgi:hypothetical protein